MAFIGSHEDRLAIRDLNDAYADAVMVGDAEAWGNLWVEDSYWSLPEFPGHEEFVGREAIVKGWQWSMDLYGKPREDGGKAAMIYMVTPGAIEVDGDRATARVYTFDVCTRPGDNHETRTYGQYDDELVRRDGKWLFKKRTYKVLAESR